MSHITTLERFGIATVRESRETARAPLRIRAARRAGGPGLYLLDAGRRRGIMMRTEGWDQRMGVVLWRHGGAVTATLRRYV